MGRIIREIEIEGKKAIALFDTGAYHTCITERFLTQFPKLEIKKPYTVALGGEKIIVNRAYIFQGKIDGLDFDSKAVGVVKLGSADGYDLDVIIGALTMEEWEIKLDPKAGKLDLEGLRRREFTEF